MSLGDFAALRKGHRRNELFESLENLVTYEEGFALTTAAPLQRAICRAYDGRDLGDDLWELEEVQRAFGYSRPPSSRPREMLVLSGIRTAKSLIAAAAGVYQTQVCSFEYADGHTLGPGEMPRVSIVSLRKDLADVIMGHIVGNLQARPALKRLMLSEASSDSVILRHPTGRPVEIKVVAGARSGSTLVARWSAGVIFDEAPRMMASADAKVNLEDMRGAVLGRMLDNTVVWYVGSPWQPHGPVYNMVQQHHRKPDPYIRVVKAPAYDMNPVYWTKERCDKFREQDPDAAKTDLDAEFSDPETQLFKLAVLESSRREEPDRLPYDQYCHYAAAMDPATRSNAWTLVIVTRRDNKLVVVGCWQWLGGKNKPLSPKATCAEIAEVLQTYSLDFVISDQWSVDSIRDFLLEHGVSLLQSQRPNKEMVRITLNLAKRMEAGLVELPPDELMQRDLLGARRILRGGTDGISIKWQVTDDGRHSDYGPALVLAGADYLDEPLAPGREDEYPEPEDERIEREAWEREFLEDEAVDDSWVDLYD